MKITLIVTLIISLTSNSAMAHSGHGLDSMMAGFIHPFSGIDHLLVMLAIGIWAAKLGGVARWQLPLTFVLLMLVGAAFGMLGLNAAGVEPAIAASVLLMGVILMTTFSVNRIAQMGLTALFAWYHGFAHGLALSSANALLTLVAMMVATSLLHYVGYCLGKQHQFLQVTIHRLFAGMLMLVGTYLLLA